MVQRVRRTLTWIAVAVAWSCGGASVTGVDATPDGVSSIAVSPSSITLALGGEAPLQATVLDASGRARADLTVIWSVKDTSIARVSSSGVVSALGVGNTQIAASAGGVSAIATLAVQPPPVASVVVQPLTQTLVLGQSAAFSATPRDVNGAPLSGRVVNWSSANDGVATVSQDGQVTTHAVGTATITATSEGVSGSATVTVSPVPVASVSVQPANATLTVGGAITLTAQARDAGDSPLDRVISWSTDNPAVAVVSAAGVVTAVAPGSATITAQSEGKSGTTTVTVSRVPVASVAMAPASASLVVGGTLSLTATPKDAGGTSLIDRVVTWSSSDIQVAVVSSTGVVSGVASGSAVISATSEGKAGTSTITVTAPPVANVSVQPATASVQVGGTTTFTVTATDAGGAVLTGGQVTWSSSNVAVATVSATGIVTARAVGTATISATSGGKSGSATVTVVPVPVGSVSITPPAATAVPGQVVLLSAVVRDANDAIVANRAVTWTSSNPAIATVSANGTLTAVAVGTATVTATSEGKTGTSTITVVSMPVGSVTINPSSANVTTGSTVVLSATVKDTSGTTVTGRVVTWSSSDATIATVSSTGVVTAVSPGSATITATSEGISGVATVIVSRPAVASVALAPGSASLDVGATLTLVATMKDAGGAVLTGRLVAWSSSVPGVATVSANGVVTGLAPGTTTITASSEGVNGTAVIVVNNRPVGSVVVLPTSATVTTGQTATLTATVRDSAGVVVTDRVVTWTSSDINVAVVSPTGVVTGVSPGTANITATSEGKSGTSVVTVVAPAVANVAVQPGTATVQVGATTTLTATVTDANGAVLAGRPVTWVSNNVAVATVSATGVVTGQGAGNATISATSGGRTGSATVTVVLVPVGSVVVTPSTPSVITGSTVALSTTVRDTSGAVATGRAVTWSSSDATIASVSGTGVVTAVSPGTATITATSEGISGHAVVTVLPIPVASVTLAPTSVTLTPGQTATLTATTKSADGTVLTGRVVTFGSDDVGVVQVSSDGVVTGVSPGTATITATSEGQTATATVTVQPAVAYVLVAPSSVFVRRNGTVQLSVTAYDAGGHAITGRSVTWASGDEHLATVSGTGLVTAKRTGTVTITATIDGKSDSSQLTITN